jgi:hypothetical protein
MTAVRSTACLAAVATLWLAAGVAAAGNAPEQPAKKDAKTTAAAKPAAAAQQKLNLETPALERVYSRSELRYILAAPDNIEIQEAASVSVQSTHYLEPVPMGQFQAIPWAFTHPLQAWRVLAPVQSP